MNDFVVVLLTLVCSVAFLAFSGAFGFGRLRSTRPAFATLSHGLAALQTRFHTLNQEGRR